jgi:hypothetical protein
MLSAEDPLKALQNLATAGDRAETWRAEAEDSVKGKRVLPGARVARGSWARPSVVQLPDLNVALLLGDELLHGGRERAQVVELPE